MYVLVCVLILSDQSTYIHTSWSMKCNHILIVDVMYVCMCLCMNEGDLGAAHA